MAINYGILGAVISIALLVVFIMLWFAYHKRAPAVLRVFGSTYFRFEILSPARKTQTVYRMTKDFKIIGSTILFKAPGGLYKVIDDCIFLRDKIPTSLYKFGNPLPINVYGHSVPIVKVWDEDNKTFTENELSAQELNDAIESKVVHDLNKFTFSRMEIVMVIVGIVSIIMGVVVLYQTVQINSELGTLINELNQILSNLPSHASSASPT